MAIFIITAPSGAGKTSLSNRVAEVGLWKECISHTTRPIRDGEVLDKTYYFVTKEVFEKKLLNNEFAENVTYDGNNYAISHDEISRVMNGSGNNRSNNVFIIAEYDGYKQIKELYPDAVGIFLHMSKEDCMANMLLRGDSLEKATRRIGTYDDEMANKGEFDYVVKNVRGQSGKTVGILEFIVKQYN